jgi:hypothetical protein
MEPGDHYIQRKLANELLPYMVAGPRLTHRWFVRLASFYGYIADFAAALAGLGIGAPIVALLSGKTPEGKSAFEVLQEVLGPSWFGIGIAALIVWVIIRLVVQREDVLNRALLARDCAQGMLESRAKLWAILPQKAPMPEITAIQKTVDDRVANAVKNKVWHPAWKPLPPDQEIAAELNLAIAEIRARFMSNWDPAPPGGV